MFKQSFSGNFPWDGSSEVPLGPTLCAWKELRGSCWGGAESRPAGQRALKGSEVNLYVLLILSAQRLLPGPLNNTCRFCLPFKILVANSLLIAFLFREAERKVLLLHFYKQQDGKHSVLSASISIFPIRRSKFSICI